MIDTEIPVAKKPLPPELIEYFREYGSEGGKTRAKKMTAKERSESARKASKARWKKARKKKR